MKIVNRLAPPYSPAPRTDRRRFPLLFVLIVALCLILHSISIPVPPADGVPVQNLRGACKFQALAGLASGFGSHTTNNSAGTAVNN